MQQQMGWLKTNVTSGTMNALFNIDNTYGERAHVAGSTTRAASRPVAMTRPPHARLRCAEQRSRCALSLHAPALSSLAVGEALCSCHEADDVVDALPEEVGLGAADGAGKEAGEGWLRPPVDNRVPLFSFG